MGDLKVLIFNKVLEILPEKNVFYTKGLKISIVHLRREPNQSFNLSQPWINEASVLPVPGLIIRFHISRVLFIPGTSQCAGPRPSGRRRCRGRRPKTQGRRTWARALGTPPSAHGPWTCEGRDGFFHNFHFIFVLFCLWLFHGTSTISGKHHITSCINETKRFI